MQQAPCKIGAREQNDFVEQISVSYWLFYALLNNQQFMKTKFHKYQRRFPSQEVLCGFRGAQMRVGRAT